MPKASQLDTVKRIGRRRYVEDASQLPRRSATSEGEEVWEGNFGQAVVKKGVPPPEARSLQADMFWLLDNVLKVGECLDVGRNYDQVRVQVARYIRERHVPRGTIKVRALQTGKTRVWKLDTGYEKRDP